MRRAAHHVARRLGSNQRRVEQDHTEDNVVKERMARHPGGECDRGDHSLVLAAPRRRERGSHSTARGPLDSPQIRLRHVFLKHSLRIEERAIERYRVDHDI